MTFEINDEEIALMTDIAQNSPIKMTSSKQSGIERLIASGLIKRDEALGASPEFKYTVTGKGQQVLSERGVGANES
jgi:hypothetical protein